MAWKTVTPDDVQRQLAAPELTALTTAAKQVGQTADGILADAITDMVLKIRGYVAANRANILGDGATIPEELNATAIALVRDYLFDRLPGMKMLNDELRQKATDRAMRELRDVAEGRFLIVAPDVDAPKQAGGLSVTSKSNRRQITRRKMRGL